MTPPNQSALHAKPRSACGVRLWVVANGKNFAHISGQASKGRTV